MAEQARGINPRIGLGHGQGGSSPNCLSGALAPRCQALPVTRLEAWAFCSSPLPGPMRVALFRCAREHSTVTGEGFRLVACVALASPR